MADTPPGNRRVIQVGKARGGPIGGPQPPRPRTLQPRKASDYPEIPAPYLAVAQHFGSPLLLGPPLCDELVALVTHLLSLEEATLVQYLKLSTGKTAAAVAAAAHRPMAEVQPILDYLEVEKPILLTYGQGTTKRYILMPLVPGVFESIMVRTSTESLTDWHRRFAALFEQLFETGWLVDYTAHKMDTVRYIPVGQSVDFNHMALPSDRMEEILEPHTTFAVGMCQCRLTEQIIGRGCEKPMETCLGFGSIVEPLIHSGRMRRVEKQEALEIKAQAEAAGLVNFTSDLFLRVGGASCSCCGCCCHVLRTINDFNAPGLIAPPHFVPQVDLNACTYCGKCARACPMGAMVVDPRGKTHQYQAERCIGCGLCAVACNHKKAITMEPAPDYRQPPRSSLSAIWRMLPAYVRNAWSVWRKYR